MTALRELADGLKVIAGNEKRSDYAEILNATAAAIIEVLDAEGDGGAVGYVCPDDKITFYMSDGWSRRVPPGTELYAHLHPARSGGVSDEVVSDIAKMIADRVGNGMREKYENLAKQIAEHFAKSQGESNV